MKAVEQAVADVETVLKAISDEMLDETCKRYNTYMSTFEEVTTQHLFSLTDEQGKEVSRDEKNSECYYI